MNARVLVSAVILAAIALPELADGHALLVRTSPPRRAVLRDPPKQVQLWFNERPQALVAAAAAGRHVHGAIP